MPSGSRKPSRVIAGRVIKPYGILGWVRVEVLSANPRRFLPGNIFLVEGREEALVLEASRQAHGSLLVKFEGVDDRSRAGELAGEYLMITPEQMGEPPPGSYWEHDLLYLRVYDVEGGFLGEVVEVLETGANDVLVVRDEAGEERLIPLLKEVVVEIDLPGERMVIRPLPGLF
ncbi:ribosome maturation factor RimM [Candidatus Solincola sp.]|jgi:16S rRNA processing protein RimM|nr:ribosome maturation factor RimM [Actinomycetota bacterium]MDI7252777.1 ribosome maturation factor RimM [Actinomycetota bacterium]